MDRRKFLKGGVLSLGAPVAAANVGRLFGTPSSVQPRDIPSLDKFRLPLSQAGVPSELWDGLVRLSYLWDDVPPLSVAGQFRARGYFNCSA
jgi:hypothetical protein